MANKNTLVVVFGKKKASKIFSSLIWSAYLVIIGGIAVGIIPLSILIVIFTLPLCFKAVIVLRNNFNKIQELLPANAAIIALHMFFGLLVSGGYIIDKLIK